MKNNREKVIGVLKRVKDKVIDKTSDILALPAVLKQRHAEYNADRKIKQIKENRVLKAQDEAHVPDAGNETDPLFRYRINAINEAFDRERDR